MKITELLLILTSSGVRSFKQYLYIVMYIDMMHCLDVVVLKKTGDHKIRNVFLILNEIINKDYSVHRNCREINGSLG